MLSDKHLLQISMCLPVIISQVLFTTHIIEAVLTNYLLQLCSCFTAVAIDHMDGCSLNIDYRPLSIIHGVSDGAHCECLTKEARVMLY